MIEMGAKLVTRELFFSSIQVLKQYEHDDEVQEELTQPPKCLLSSLQGSLHGTDHDQFDLLGQG